jgi:three-Cys-motif partner protein
MKPRLGHVWTADKLDFLEKYLPAFAIATKRAREAGAEIHYVDGFAGPGINDINGELRNGSPLIAVANDFDRYHLVEQRIKIFRELKRHIELSEKFTAGQVSTLERGDFNQLVVQILLKIPRYSPTFFLLDPEGLELHWETVSQIGQRQRADVFVLVSASGVHRCVKEYPDVVTRFYGTDEWKTLDVNPDPQMLGSSGFLKYLDFYRERLTTLGFTAVEHFMIAKTSTNTPLHGLIFAAKHQTAIKIASDVLRRLQGKGQNPLF